MCTYLIPRFMVSEVPIIDMPNNMLLQILAAWNVKKSHSYVYLLVCFYYLLNDIKCIDWCY